MRLDEKLLLVLAGGSTAVVPYLAYFTDYVPASTRFALISGIVLFLVFSVAAAVFSGRDAIETRLSAIEGRIASGAIVRPFLFKDFYHDFLPVVETAKNRVDLTYLKNSPPESLAIADADDYYRKLPRVVGRQKSVMFRRIVRSVPQNKDWVYAMTREFQGIRNFSLALLPHTSPETDSILPISVQLVDSDKTYLLSIGRQNRGENRDAMVVSEDFAEIWTQYYDRLWSESVEIISNGKLNPIALAQCFEGGGAGGTDKTSGG